MEILSLRIQDYSEISWGWDWIPQNQSREGFGFLGYRTHNENTKPSMWSASQLGRRHGEPGYAAKNVVVERLMTKNHPCPSLRDPIYSSSENGKLGHSWLENHQFLIGTTSSNGPFSIAMLVYWNLNLCVSEVMIHPLLVMWRSVSQDPVREGI